MLRDSLILLDCYIKRRPNIEDWAKNEIYPYNYNPNLEYSTKKVGNGDT